MNVRKRQRTCTCKLHARCPGRAAPDLAVPAVGVWPDQVRRHREADREPDAKSLFSLKMAASETSRMLGFLISEPNSGNHVLTRLILRSRITLDLLPIASPGIPAGHAGGHSFHRATPSLAACLLSSPSVPSKRACGSTADPAGPPRQSGASRILR